MIKNSLYIILLLLLSSCADFKDIEVGEPEDIKIKGIRDNVVRLGVKIPVKNPSSFNFRIKEINLKTSVNNQYLGRIVSDNIIVIPAKSNEIYNLNLKLKIANIIQKPKPKPHEPAEPELEPESVKEEKEIALEISFIERTWIQIYADGQLMVDGIKLPGEEVKIIATEELVLNLGNAGGISYTLNNKKGKKLGPSGAVRNNRRITFENLQEYIEQE